MSGTLAKKGKMSQFTRFVKILEFFQFRIQLMSIGGLIINRKTEIFITIFNDITLLT